MDNRLCRNNMEQTQLRVLRTYLTWLLCWIDTHGGKLMAMLARGQWTQLHPQADGWVGSATERALSKPISSWCPPRHRHTCNDQRLRWRRKSADKNVWGGHKGGPLAPTYATARLPSQPGRTWTKSWRTVCSERFPSIILSPDNSRYGPGVQWSVGPLY